MSWSRKDAAAIAQAAIAITAFVAMNRGWLDAPVLIVGYVAFALLWPPTVNWGPLPARAVLRTYLPFAAAWVVFVVVYLRAMHALGWTVAPQPMLQRIADGSPVGGGLGGATWAGLFVGIVFLGPILEEHVFRGYLWAALRSRSSAAVTNVLTAAVFGAFHGWHYALPIGVLGWFFGYLRAKYDALLPAVYAHALHNGLTVAVASLWPGHLELLYPR